MTSYNTQRSPLCVDPFALRNYKVITRKQQQISECIQLFRGMDPRFPINAIQVFFYVAEHGSCLKQDMELALNFNPATGSRNSDYLSNNHRLRKPGMGLITKEDYPPDRRNSILSLTDKGRQLLDAIAN